MTDKDLIMPSLLAKGGLHPAPCQTLTKKNFITTAVTPGPAEILVRLNLIVRAG